MHETDIGFSEFADIDRNSALTLDGEMDMESLKKLARRVVKNDIESAKNSSDKDQPRRMEFYNLYRARTDVENDREGRSRITSSDVMDAVEWIMPSLMKAFAGRRKAIEVNPQGKEDVAKAEKFEKLLNWQLMSNCQGFLTLNEWIKAGLVYGTSFIKVGWENNYVRKGFSMPEVLEPQLQEMMNDDEVESLSYGGVNELPVLPAAMSPIMQQQQGYNTPNAYATTMQPHQIEAMRVYSDVQGEKKILTYSGPKIDVIPPDDFLVDPDAKDVEQARFVIHKVSRTISYLRELERDGIYSNIDEVIRYSSNTSSDQRNSDNTEEIARAISTGNSSGLYPAGNASQQQVGRRKVDVYEWWGQLDVKGDGITEPYLVVMVGDVIIRMERNPYAHGKAPFIDLRPLRDIFSFHGIGMAELVGEFQQIKTAIMRQSLDNLSFINNQMWEVDENAGVDVDSLINPRPGQVVFTNRLQSIKPLTPNSFDGFVYSMLEHVQGQLEQRTGVTRYNQGLDANSLNKTATGIRAIMSASEQRIEMMARTIAETGVRRLYLMMLSLDQQFIDQTLVVRIFNEPLEISPDDLAGNFDVTVDIGGATHSEEQEIEQLMTLMQQAPFLMQIGVMRPMNVFEMCKKIMDIWGFKDPSNYLSDPQDAAMAQQVMQAIGQLMMMAQSGQMPSVMQIAQVLQAAYGVLAKLSGADIGVEQSGGQGTNANRITSGTDIGTAGALHSAAAGQNSTHEPSVIPNRYGRSNGAGGMLSGGGS